jgi:uncharacterized protein YegL
MAGQKIQSLNFAIRECIPEMQNVAKENPEAQMFVRVLTFSSGARWHVGTPTPLASFKWDDVQADGVTDMGRAMELLADALSMDAMGQRALPPVLVLITDGQPTDNFNAGLKKLMESPWARKAVRIGIAMGDDAAVDVIGKFIDHPEFKPLRADNAPTLARLIKWASTAVVKSASTPSSQVAGRGPASGTNVPVPTPPPAVPSNGLKPDDVW